MARVTYVKRAQQKYATKPVLDEQGNPVKIPLTRKDGSPKMTSAKRGRTPRPVFITKTERDLTRPLPNEKCGKCGVEIKPGDPYKWIKPKSGPYGGRRMVRCAACPTWQVWDYSSSLSAQIARIEYDATTATIDSVEDATSVLEQAAQEIRDLAEQKRESAQNIEDGFGHPTYQSEELEQQADDLEGWADEVESTEVPEQDEYAGPVECDECDGTGTVTDNCPDCDGAGVLEDEPEQPECDTCNGEGTLEDSCGWCGGTGEVETDDLTDDQLDEWREAVEAAISDALGNCPV